MRVLITRPRSLAGLHCRVSSSPFKEYSLVFVFVFVFSFLYFSPFLYGREVVWYLKSDKAIRLIELTFVIGLLEYAFFLCEGKRL